MATAVPHEAVATDDDRDFDHITQTLAPSHILANGRFVYLPLPSAKERVLFFERAIARHGLLQEDLTDKKREEEKEKKEGEDDKKPKVHPLALASARLQANGINELNRVINLATLVSTGEYFGMSNIVDPSLEISVAEKASVEKKESAVASTAAATASGTGAQGAAKTDASTAALEVQEEQRVKALYVLKRKRSQFQKAGEVFRRHRRRLASAVVAQARPDQRLRELRKQWHLVAPEHGTRALPHATRPTEVVACDVDVYWKGGTVLGRLARRVPRYATVELKEGYKVHGDLRAWERKLFNHSSDEMDVDDASGENTESVCCTKTEPFAIADPTLGKLDADFDPSKVVMLSLQFDIEKPSTGFCQSACLEPMTTASTAAQGEQYEDEAVLVSLQHSLFCAKLFESIRREIAPDTEEVGQIRILSAATQSSVWLSSCASEENYLPAVARMSGDSHCGLAPMCVIHCHEGEVKVQLDCEYTLRVRLVENEKHATSTTTETSDAIETDSTESSSGSQTPSQLLFLCRALLLHAQETYHTHSIQADAKLRKAELEKKVETPGHLRVQKTEQEQSPRILQSCVTLGTKMLLEERIRKVLFRVNEWLVLQQQEYSVRSSCLSVLWLPLSVFDLSAQFNLSFQDLWSIDVNLFNDEITVTQVTDQGDYSKVKFHSHTEFELYLHTALRRVLKQKKQ